jgi:cellulose synthase (UDP-forming)
VIVPTYSEPLHMVVNVVRSILDQDWPIERLRIVVSDDAHNDQVRNAFATMAAELPEGVLLYNRPPKKGDPARRGESKSGNLNSAILLLDDCDFIETRDADDLVGSSNFLRATVGQLMDDPGLGFIQTIKETATSPGDPFNNNEPFFYRGTMLARNADYAIFPCGSGLVWRRAALKQIDDFPVWNLVEDLHSGVLGLRAGWRGLYVPIVGAYAQHSPEDVANVFKQRGTWALDTTRILVFDRFKGIPRKMRLHFIEQALFYLLSFPLMILILVPAVGLFFDRFPLETDPTTYAVHFWGFALSIELILLALAADQIAGSLWRSRLSWVGMAPIYAKAAIRAVWYGPRRKPVYKVTRKTDDYQVYIKLVKSHWAMIVATVVGIVVAVFRDNFLTELDLGSLYWGIVAMVGLGAFLRLSWFGVDIKQRFTEKFESPINYWWPVMSPLVMPVVHVFKPPAIDTRSLADGATVRLRRLIASRVQSEE